MRVNKRTDPGSIFLGSGSFRFEGIFKMKKMVSGKKYRVEFNDGCVDGFFVGVFKKYLDYSNNDEGVYVQEIPGHDDFEAVFDIGRIGPGWGSWRAEEVI